MITFLRKGISCLNLRWYFCLYSKGLLSDNTPMLLFLRSQGNLSSFHSTLWLHLLGGWMMIFRFYYITTWQRATWLRNLAHSSDQAYILRSRLFINKSNLPNWEQCVFIWWSTVLLTRSVCVNVCFLQLKSTHRAYPFITFLYWAIKIFCDVYCEDNVVEKGMVWFHIMIIRGSKILKGIIS